MDDLLRSKLKTLESLVRLLPESLPLQHSGAILFALDSDDIEDLGIAGALNRCFELNWGMKTHGIHVRERGDKLSTTAAIFRRVLEDMKATDDAGLVGIWMDALIGAVTAALEEPPSMAAALVSFPM